MQPLLKLYHQLLNMYGHQAWWPAETPFEVMVGAVLTQNTAWTNVEKAIANLKKNRCLTAEKILATPIKNLAEWLRPSGYFNIKAKRLKHYCEWYLQQGGYENLAQQKTLSLRHQLLNVSGVGPETADDILLYAFDRPVFVIDAYTRRLLQRLEIIHGNESYEELRALMEAGLPKKVFIYQQYHALIVQHAKQRCRKKLPLCDSCDLIQRCSEQGILH